ncbi:MAG: DUF342 domain-containing protein [Leptospira sp.]|nr:DUF342 domain-containing protein [Leptospira sp.]
MEEGKENTNPQGKTPSNSQVENTYDLDLGLKISTSEDLLEATLIVKPSWLVGKNITMSEISMTLERYSLSEERVDFSGMEKIMNEINARLNSKKGLGEELVFTIATGIPPKEGLHGWVKYEYPKATRVVIKEDGSADFRNIDRFIHVKTDYKLASLFEGLPGKSGIDVFGKPVPPKPIRKVQIKIGNNIREDVEKNPENPLTNIKVYYATCNGVIYTTDNSITVSPELNIESDVGLETGNINYEGTVKVQGNIIEGSQVVCKGSLSVGGNVETMNVMVEENLEVKGGIKGKDKMKGMIRVIGDLHAKFIENANLEVEGDIVVENNILNSKIQCLGSIFLSADNSSIVASDVVSFRGLSVSNLGSNAELDTKIEVGFHYKNNRLYQEGKTKLHNYEEESKGLEPKILKIKDIVTRSRGKLDEEKKLEFKAIFEDYSKRKKVIELFHQKLELLKNSRFNTDNVKVVIRNQAFPGSFIRYRKQIEKITTLQSSFMLNFFPNQEKAVPMAWKKDKN